MKYASVVFIVSMLSACSSTYHAYDLDINVTTSDGQIDVECELDGQMRLHVSGEELVGRCNDAVYGYLVAADLNLSESDIRNFFSGSYEASATHSGQLSNEDSFSRSEYTYRRKIDIAPTPTDGI